MNLGEQILKQLQERKQYNSRQRNNCLAGEDQMCIDMVEAIIKSQKKEDLYD